MPQPPEILASMISITFVGVKRLPKEWLKNTFQVRRHHVLEALTWLKKHNAYYSDIEISEARLEDLPEDDIPDQIWSLTQEEEDQDILERERANHIPENEEDIEAGGMSIVKGLINGILTMLILYRYT